MDALNRLRGRLASRIRDPKIALVPGLADDLRSISEGFEELRERLQAVERVAHSPTDVTDKLASLDERTSALAAFALRKHFWPRSAVSSSNLRRLMEMGGDASTASHGERCICEQCMGHGG